MCSLLFTVLDRAPQGQAGISVFSTSGKEEESVKAETEPVSPHGACVPHCAMCPRSLSSQALEGLAFHLSAHKVVFFPPHRVSSPEEMASLPEHLH